MPDRRSIGPWVRPTILFGAFFGSWLLLVTTMWRYPLVLSGAMLVVVGAYFAFLREPGGAFFFVVAAVFGPVGEGTVSATGLWTYYGATVLGIPYWLPLAWGITAVAIHKYIESGAPGRPRGPGAR